MQPRPGNQNECPAIDLSQVRINPQLMKLIPPDLARRVKDLLRAGANEYWILPLDSGPFPPRLYVLLEWGQSVLSGIDGRGTTEGLTPRASGGILARVGDGLRRLMGGVRQSPTATVPVKP